METATWPKHAAPLYDDGGPTGEYVEVLEGQLQDYGGNLLFAGTADECLAEYRTYRLRLLLVPTRCRRLSHPAAGADVDWSATSAATVD